LSELRRAESRLDALTKEDLTFEMVNTAQDPDTGVYYYYFVDLGRGPVKSSTYVQTATGGQRLKKLAYRDRHGDWHFATSVGPARGHRLTAAIRRELKRQLPQVVKEVYLDGSPFSVQTLRAVVKKMQTVSVKIAKETVMDTIPDGRGSSYRTRSKRYKVSVKGLADSFQIKDAEE
jgi:hypothetical protein